jgi:CubicO group peptidase (beta-lactamase class C family)
MAFYLITLSSVFGQHQAYIDSLIAANFDENGPGGVLLVAKDGEPIYRKGFGFASLELEVKNDPSMSYRIGSVSKQFTAVAVLQLVQKGEIYLDDPVTKYLPDYNTYGETITINHLLSHTSGIPSYTENPVFAEKMFEDQSKKELIESFEKDSLLFKPGTDWSYSNSGYVLAGLVVEKVSGMDLNDYYQQFIFDPLEMNNTYIGTYDKVLPNTAYGYASAADGNYRPARYLSWTWPYAAGSIISSVDDMLKWDNALYTEKILNREMKAEAWKPFILDDGRLANYGYGWGVSRYLDTRIIAHGGGINGFVCMGIRIPKERVYVILLTNSTTVSPGPIAEKIALKVANLPQPKAKPMANPDFDLSAYEGAYQVHTSGGRIVSNYSDTPIYRYITLDGDTLRSQKSGEGKKALIPVKKDLFYFKDSDLNYLQFFRGEKGETVALEIYTEPVKFGPDEYEPKVDVEMPGEKTEVEVDASILKRYEGRYDFGSGFFMEVVVEGNELFIIPTAQPKQKAYAESENSFFFKEVDASMKFVEEDGEITKMVFTQGMTYEAGKVE